MMSMFEEEKVIYTKRLFMRKPIVEDIDQFYNILKKILLANGWLNQEECRRKKQMIILGNLSYIGNSMTSGYGCYLIVKQESF